MTVSAFAIEKGPGPQVGSSYSSGAVEELLDDRLGAVQPSLSSLRRQTTMFRRPPGRKASRTLRSAATGFAKNIVPNRANA